MGKLCSRLGTLVCLTAALGGCQDPVTEGSPAGLGDGSTGDEAPDGGSDGSTTGDEPTASTGDAPPDDGSGTGSSGTPGAWCEPIPTCDAPLPSLTYPADWNRIESVAIAASGPNNHRGRDMFYTGDEPQWVLGKMAYGVTDWDLSGEDVELYLLRGCEGDWEPLGVVTTTFDGEHPTVQGVEDSGGRIYFEIPAGRRLEPGRHRVHMIVRGDDSRADTFIEVVPPGTPLFVSDIDGTLTTFEQEEFVDLLTGSIPDANPMSAEALQLLTERGYHAMYVTARPEFLGQRTQEFISRRGFPPGIVHTTLSTTGALGQAAVDYKTGELAALSAQGLHPSYLFGNTDSDAEAYDAMASDPDQERIFFQFQDPHGSRTIESYGELLAEFAALPDLCE